MKDTTINIEETIQTINKQNKRIEELCLEIERLNNNWQKLKDEIKESKKICIAHNNDIGISFLDTMLHKIELIEEKNK